MFSQVQDAIGDVMNNLRDVLHTVLDTKRSVVGAYQAMDVDGFAPIRTTQAVTPSPEASLPMGGARASQRIADICMAFIAIVPILQSFSGESTRDKELVELVVNCADDKFLLIGPIYFEKIRRRVLNVNLNVLDCFLGKFEPMLMQYEYSRSEQLQLLVTHFLHSTLTHWLADAVSGTEVGEQIRALCRWLLHTLRGQKIRSWRTRDCVIRFLTRYISEDAAQVVWSIRPAEDVDDEEPDALPADTLPRLGADPDIRIRFRIAVASASLFSIARETGQDPSQAYVEIKECLTNDIFK